MSSGMCGQRRPRSACTSVQSDLGLCCPLTESVDTTECIHGEQMPGPSCSKLKMSLKFTSSDTQIC